jgi:Uma2 family endonuclease
VGIHLVPIITPQPVPGTTQVHRISVADYHRMIATGIFDGQRIELLDGYLLRKTAVNPPHSHGVQQSGDWLTALVGSGWVVRWQQPITLTTSEPEPDIAIAKAPKVTYAHRHPGPADLALVVEVADSSLAADRTIKGPLYGAAGIPVYWIVDVVHRQVEVYTLAPGGTAYAAPIVLVPGQLLPVVIAGVHLGDIPVADLFV